MRASPDDLVAMAVFVRVVDARSFAAAAREMGLSKSVVSARIAKLEERLGVRLLHRTTRRLALTTEGVRFYERCARVIADADEAAELVAGSNDSPRGLLRVGAPSAFGQLHLAAPIAEFLRLYPDVRVELQLGDRVVDLVEAGLDVAIRVGRRIEGGTLLIRKLASDRAVACASASYLRRVGIPWRPQDLVHHNCLGSSLARGEQWEFKTSEGIIELAGTGNLTSDSTVFLREAALAGSGIALLPRWVVAGDLASGALRPVLEDFEHMEMAVYAVRPQSRLVPAKVTAFLDHLSAYFRSPSWAPERTGSGLGGAGGARKAPARNAPATSVVTEQDLRRLTAVISLCEEIDAPGTTSLQEELARASVVAPHAIASTVVTMNSKVVCRERGGTVRELSVVYPWHADANDRISVLAPLGRALLGARVGDAVDVAAARGVARRATIESIRYQPESAGDWHL